MRERQPPEGIGAPLAPGAVDLQGLQNGLAGLTGLERWNEYLPEHLHAEMARALELGGLPLAEVGLV